MEPWTDWSLRLAAGVIPLNPDWQLAIFLEILVFVQEAEERNEGTRNAVVGRLSREDFDITRN